ncbi:MAG: hypothetical protein BWY09_02459 [Candidatus Hydrogenedentes bacterium ADurb.Bin179]|nr:MAG: hypothetical protein BWY09_02459 [Candidatus Hydrogenedentes bacterium ADurb.Bin179]
MAFPSGNCGLPRRVPLVRVMLVAIASLVLMMVSLAASPAVASPFFPPPFSPGGVRFPGGAFVVTVFPRLLLAVSSFLRPVLSLLVPVLVLLSGWPPFLAGAAPFASFAFAGGGVLQGQAYPHRTFAQS